MKYKHIIWDWNGTLFDDLWLCVELCSKELKNREMSPINRETYRRKICHPICTFYERLGIDLAVHPFEELTDSFHEEYMKRITECELYEDIRPTLARLSKQGISHSILSALPHKILLKSVDLCGLTDLFTDIRGLDTNHADSKVQNGIEWLSRQSYDTEQVLFVGDTDHDLEVARELDIQCVLISRGHQHPDRLRDFGVPLLTSAAELLEYLENNN